MVYEIESWAVKNQHKHKVSVVEMTMLRWMYGETKEDRIRNDDIRKSWGNNYSRKETS